MGATRRSSEIAQWTTGRGPPTPPPTHPPTHPPTRRRTWSVRVWCRWDEPGAGSVSLAVGRAGAGPSVPPVGERGRCGFGVVGTSPVRDRCRWARRVAGLPDALAAAMRKDGGGGGGDGLGWHVRWHVGRCLWG